MRVISRPPLNKAKVGMLRISCAALVCGLASVSSLTWRICGCILADCANCGAIVRHGPHHGAQKSTKTGKSVPAMNLSKFASFSSIGFASSKSCWHLPQLTCCVRASLATRFFAPQAGQTKWVLAVMEFSSLKRRLPAPSCTQGFYAAAPSFACCANCSNASKAANASAAYINAGPPPI